MELWEDGTFEVYLVQREGAQKERAEHWQIAIGSQDVVHLKKRDIYWMWRIYMRVVN